LATVTPLPNPFLPVTATPAADQPATEPFAPYGEVAQPAYAVSDCSDKYPCNDDVAAWESRIQVPAGFKATYFAHLEGQQPTALTFGPDGTLYVATQGGSIFALNAAGEATLFFEGLKSPTGLGWRPGTNQLYVSSRVVEENMGGSAKISVIENGQETVIIDGLPCCYAFMHGPHAIVFDSQGWGYVGVGATSDHGEVLGSDNVQAELGPYEARLLRFSPDGKTVETFATGLRNPYGITIDSNDQLFATDNGPDFGPADEFHRIMPGENHGYPWYDCPACFPKPADVNPVPTTYEYPPHSAPTGITTYLGAQFPNAYNNLFAVLWSAFPDAQRVMRHGPNGEGAETFATGFAAPIGIAAGPDGALYVADWATGIVFQISYVGQ
jgi:glucose/arabinose dehydrogenase